MKKQILLLGLSTLIALLLLEGGLAFGTRTGRFPIKAPSYSLERVRKPLFWRDANPVFGVWHEPNAATRQTTSCFDVTYRSNSYGARDPERTLQSHHPRVLVLGDSMIEGYGVAESDRLTNRLERETGIEHLNFGTSGSFGTTQYFLVYQTLASRFSHAAVIIGMLPDNDFWDNDYEFGKQVYADRYRPYLVGAYPNYQLVHFQESMEQSSLNTRAGWMGFGRRVLSEFTYGYNALFYFKQLVTILLYPDLAKGAVERTQQFFEGKGQTSDPLRPYSGFYDFRQDQVELVEYTFEQIQRVAGDRNVIIALLPTLADLRRYDPSARPPLSARLERFAEARGMQLVDLLPDLYRNRQTWDRYFLPCDPHWSPEGHAVAAHSLHTRLAALYRDLANPDASSSR